MRDQTVSDGRGFAGQSRRHSSPHFACADPADAPNLLAMRISALTLFLLAAAAFGAPALAQSDAAADAAAAADAPKPKKIVLIAGKLDSHPPATHEYEKSALLMKHCLDTAPNLPAVNTEVHFGGWPADEGTLAAAAVGSAPGRSAHGVHGQVPRAAAADPHPGTPGRTHAVAEGACGDRRGAAPNALVS